MQLAYDIGYLAGINSGCHCYSQHLASLTGISQKTGISSLLCLWGAGFAKLAPVAFREISLVAALR